MHCPFHPCLSETFARRSWRDGLRRGGIGCKQSAGVGKQSSRVIAEREVSEGGRE